MVRTNQETIEKNKDKRFERYHADKPTKKPKTDPKVLERQRVAYHRRKDASKLVRGPYKKRQLPATESEETAEKSPTLTDIVNFTYSEKEKEIMRDAIYENGKAEKEQLQTNGLESVSREIMRTLRPCCWLNDEVINIFLRRMEAEQPNCFMFNTGFMIHLMMSVPNTYNGADTSNFHPLPNHLVKKWKRGVDIFAMDKIIFPINQKHYHWSCAVAYMGQKSKRLIYYDSMGDTGLEYLDAILDYLKAVHLDKKKVHMPDSWTWTKKDADVKLQSNGHDCGVFVCLFSEFIIKDLNLPNVCTKSFIDKYRERIGVIIMSRAGKDSQIKKLETKLENTENDVSQLQQELKMSNNKLEKALAENKETNDELDKYRAENQKLRNIPPPPQTTY